MRNHTSRSHHSWRHGWSNRPRRSKSERLPSMIHHRPEPSDGSQTGGRHARSWRRRVWSCQPYLGWLERRTLLAAPADLPAEAVPLALGSPHAATIAPLAATYYSVSSNAGGKLTVMLDALGFAARLSLVDAEGQPLGQSDGPATGAGDGLIDVNVPAGIDFLEVQSLFGGGTYQITADLIRTVPPFQRVPTHSSHKNPIAAGKFYGTGFPFDLVARSEEHTSE